jgi:hypothetical protein
MKTGTPESGKIVKNSRSGRRELEKLGKQTGRDRWNFGKAVFGRAGRRGAEHSVERSLEE